MVTAVDAARVTIAVARSHAAEMGLEIDYRAGEVGALRDEGPRFDLVTAMEVVEHVSDVPAFIAALAALVKPDGDRKSVGSGKMGSVRLALGGRRIIQKKKIKE